MLVLQALVVVANALAALAFVLLLDVRRTQRRQGHHMANALEDLKNSVANVLTVEQSAVTLIQGLKARLDAAIESGDPDQLKQLSAELGQSSAALSAAVLANTPADPNGAPPPADAPQG
jgi:hypothetical protein